MSRTEHSAKKSNDDRSADMREASFVRALRTLAAEVREEVARRYPLTEKQKAAIAEGLGLKHGPNRKK